MSFCGKSRSNVNITLQAFSRRSYYITLYYIIGI
uniref:Uncharacterized protein n=1 Tax=Anguilla anguilla TaxID=7936 RepID=A0A0E9R947_ANGAN